MTAGISDVAFATPQRLSHRCFMQRAVAFVTFHKLPYYSPAVGNFVLVPVVVKVRKGQMIARQLPMAAAVVASAAQQPGSGDNRQVFSGLGKNGAAAAEARAAVPRRLIHQWVRGPGIIPTGSTTRS